MELGPFPIYTFIHCREDEVSIAKRVALPDDEGALDHARTRLLNLPPEWVSIVIARGREGELGFIGAWDRDDGALRWEPASH